MTVHDVVAGHKFKDARVQALVEAVVIGGDANPARLFDEADVNALLVMFANTRKSWAMSNANARGGAKVTTMDAMILAARDGDEQAQEALTKYGVDWKTINVGRKGRK